MYKGKRVACVIPALDEEAAIKKVVTALLQLEDNQGQKVIDQLVVCDNGSIDNTALESERAGAEVATEARPGYGRACLKAIAQIRDCDFLLFVDGDDSCFSSQAVTLLEGLNNGADLSIGSRVLGRMEKGALTLPQRFGNWLAAMIIQRLWKQKVTDLGPFRAIRWASLQSLQMQDETFGWTVEMQVKAIQRGLSVEEYPVDSKVRIGQSKISGTLKGTVLAGIGILSMIFRLWWCDRFHSRTRQRASTRNN